MVKFCLPIIASNSSEIRNIIDGNREHYDCFEVWLDYVQDFDLKFLDTLKSMEQVEIIVLFRRNNLEDMRMPLLDRLEILKNLDHSNVLVDIDFPSQQDELSFIKNQNLTLKLIASYHNYKKTPEASFFDELIENMTAFDPYVYKFSTYCTDEYAGLRLIQLMYRLKSSGVRFIVTGMGELGKLVRVAGAISGNEFNFAPRSHTEESAPGQLTLKELQKVINIMET